MFDFELFDKILDDIYNNKILLDLDNKDINILKELNNTINKYELYRFQFHGIYHSQKVMLFSYLIGKHEGLNDDEMKILLDAAIYHDIGRDNEFEDTVHGLVSANKYDKLFKKDSFYSNENNMKLLKAITDIHSSDDKNSFLTFENYELPEELRNTYTKLFTILKDADALDRTRFPKLSEAFIKDDFLRLDYSKQLISFASTINKMYRDYINDNNFERYSALFSNSNVDNGCFHGIGWDFSKLDSILDNGILSKYAASKENVEISRNFNGNNSDMWISVIDSNDIQKNGVAYETFINNNIVFYAFVPKYMEGALKKSEAYSNGLPIASGLYEDESFVFDRIPKENIFGFIIPKGMMEAPLKDLCYLYCSHNFESLDERINSYHNYIKNTTGVEFSLDETNTIIEHLKENEILFSKMDVSLQQQKEILDGFNKMTDDSADKLNSIVANWMDISFRLYFNLSEDENPTVGMLVNDILKKKNIDFEIIDSEETIVNINYDKKEIKKDH